MALDSQRLRPGTLLGDRFEILARAGAGGQGTVYRAWDAQREVAVAVKTLGGHRPPEQELARFVRESTLLAQVAHPSIANYVGHGVEDGMHYLAEEWIEGHTLATHLERHGFDVGESIDVVRRIAEALGAAHARGIIHRDVKPGNCMCRGGRPDDVVLIDFGLARHDLGDDRVTQTGGVVGTPGYMSPEQARGARDLDARSDVFSLGCVLYQCLTGRPPFTGDDVTAARVKAILCDESHLRALRGDIPPELERLVARMMAKVPFDRPRDGAAVAEQLRAITSVEPGKRWKSPAETTTRCLRRRLRPASFGLRLVMMVASDDNELLRAIGGRLRRAVFGADRYARNCEIEHLESFMVAVVEPVAPEAAAWNIAEIAESIRGAGADVVLACAKEAHSRLDAEVIDEALRRINAARWRRSLSRATASSSVMLDEWFTALLQGGRSPHDAADAPLSAAPTGLH